MFDSTPARTPLHPDTSQHDESVLALTYAPLSAEVTVVSGSRQEERESLDTKVDVVGRAQIPNTSYQTVGEVLRQLPGVMTRRGSETAGAAVEQVQGIAPAQMLVLQDASRSSARVALRAATSISIANQ